MTEAYILALARDAAHRFHKAPADMLQLVQGLGVAGDAHAGATVRHRSRVARDPNQPNLRQVHLIHGELLDELNAHGFAVAPGQLGENVTTRGLDLLSLPTGTRLALGDTAVLEVTGLRNPCRQLDAFRPGLMQAVLARAEDGTLIRKAGVMAVVRRGGTVQVGDAIAITRPAGPQRALAPV
jgi:hypothetical protein